MNRTELKKEQNRIKDYLKGRFIWKSKVNFKDPTQQGYFDKFGGDVSLESNGTYIKPKAKDKISFTKDLRNSKGYDEYLKTKFNLS